MKLNWLSRMVLSASVVVALACGGDDDGDAEATTTTTEPPATTTTTTEPEETTTTTPEDGGDDVAATISLTVEVTSEGASLRSGTLTCGDTAEGTGHLEDPTAAAAACDLLRSNPDVVRRLVEGRDPELLCTQIYGGPEVATVTGELDGQAVDTTIDRADGCGIADWDALTAVLGPPAT